MEDAMNQLIKLAPLAVALVVFGAIVAFTVQRQMTIGTWLLAAFLLGHGLVHVMFAAPPPASANTPGAEFGFDPARSWLVTGHLLDIGVLKAIVVVLVATTIVGYALTALATVGLLVPAGWWVALLVFSTSASAALMVVGLAPGLALGVAIDVVLLAIAVTAAWSPQPGPTAA
jgi:hypothetical protein